MTRLLLMIASFSLNSPSPAQGPGEPGSYALSQGAVRQLGGPPGATSFSTNPMSPATTMGTGSGIFPGVSKSPKSVMRIVGRSPGDGRPRITVARAICPRGRRGDRRSRTPSPARHRVVPRLKAKRVVARILPPRAYDDFRQVWCSVTGVPFSV